MGNKSQKTRTTPKQFPQFFFVKIGQPSWRWPEPENKLDDEIQFHMALTQAQKRAQKRVESLSFSIAAVKNGEATHAITPKQSNLTEKLHTNRTQTRFFFKKKQNKVRIPLIASCFLCRSSFFIPFFFPSNVMFFRVIAHSLVSMGLFHLYNNGFCFSFSL